MTLSARIGAERYRLLGLHEAGQHWRHRRVHPGQGHMRGEAAPVRRDAGAVQGGANLGLQPGQVLVALDPGPDRRHPAGFLEPAQAGEAEGKAAAAQGCQSEVDLLGLQPAGLADEAQGEVEVVGGHPAGAGQVAGEVAQRLFDLPGKIEGYEQAHVLPSGRSRQRVCGNRTGVVNQYLKRLGRLG